MAKRINPSRIKKNLTYTITEAAEILEVSIPTIRNWIKLGLPIEKGQRPYLIYGVDLREFIVRKSKARKFNLRKGELGCFSCNASRPPLNAIAEYSVLTAKTGRLSGVCVVCNGNCSRIIGNTQLPAFSAILTIQFNDSSAP